MNDSLVNAPLTALLDSPDDLPRPAAEGDGGSLDRDKTQPKGR